MQESGPEPTHGVACWRWRDILPGAGPETQQRGSVGWISACSNPRPLTSGQIPVLDVAAYLAGVPGALEAAAAELRFALENIGFFYLAGHGVPQALLDRIFAETRRFHALPLGRKDEAAAQPQQQRLHAAARPRSAPHAPEQDAAEAERERDRSLPSASATRTTPT